MTTSLKPLHLTGTIREPVQADGRQRVAHLYQSPSPRLYSTLERAWTLHDRSSKGHVVSSIWVSPADFQAILSTWGCPPSYLPGGDEQLQLEGVRFNGGRLLPIHGQPDGEFVVNVLEGQHEQHRTT